MGLPMEVNGYTITAIINSRTGERYESPEAWAALPDPPDVELEVRLPGLNEPQRYGATQIVYGYLEGPFVNAKLVRLYDPVHGSTMLAERAVVLDAVDVHESLVTPARFRQFPSPELMIRGLWLAALRDGGGR